MTFLLDTNVVSELRKGARADDAVRAWIAEVDDQELFISVLVIGEIRKGIERVRRRDAAAANMLDTWLSGISTSYSSRILPVTAAIAEAWGRFNVPDPLPVIDALIAATAHVHHMAVVTRNVSDLSRTGVPVINPFEDGPPRA